MFLWQFPISHLLSKNNSVSLGYIVNVSFTLNGETILFFIMHKFCFAGKQDETEERGRVK
jgi:hypothetical protein